MDHEKFFAPEQNEQQEWGKNVSIKMKFIRHGDRNKEGYLSDFGRQDTRERASQSGLSSEDFDAVKAIGSSKGPDAEVNVKGDMVSMGRSLETPHIYVEEIDGEQRYVSRVNDLLNFETIKTKDPYNHTAIYNSNLPENYDDLEPEAKAEAGRVAQTNTVNHLFELSGPEVETWKKEVAGAFAYLLEHYKRLAKRLKADSRVLMLAGSHSPNMEMLLQQALVYKDDSGQEHVGFDDLDAIGGAIQVSDAYNVDIVLDEEGEFKDLVVTFDQPHRPQGDMHLDMDKVKELSEFYQSLHKEE